MPITKASGNSVTAAAKGDLVVGNATNDSSVLSVGANNTVLTADSAEATGVKWATPSSGGMTLLSTSTLSGASTTISSINQTYTDLFVVVNNLYISSSNDFIIVRPNGGTDNGLYTGQNNGSTTNESEIKTTKPSESSSGLNSFIIEISQYSNTSFSKPTAFYGVSKQSTGDRFFASGAIVTTSAITSMQFVTAGYGATFSGGTVLIYGVK
jgi:hypothetical protein